MVAPVEHGHDLGGAACQGRVVAAENILRLLVYCTIGSRG